MDIITRGPNFKHGLSDSPEYRAWTEIKRRCHNSNRENYPRYGGRGIGICNRWLKFENFIEDMGCRPAKGYSIGRIDNDGNYEPSNCKWVTWKEQANNRRNNHSVTIGGRTKTIQQWCDKFNIPDTTFHNRIRRGWTGKSLIYQGSAAIPTSSKSPSRQL